MKLRALFSPPAPAPRPRPRDWLDLHLEMQAAEATALADNEDTPPPCGWFDSSWSLRAGLQITEHASVDPVANDLPLGWWLEGPGAAKPPARGR